MPQSDKTIEQLHSEMLAANLGEYSNGWDCIEADDKLQPLDLSFPEWDFTNVQELPEDFRF